MENKPILIIDNYDSFTYNLVHQVAKLGHKYTVWRNDQFTLDDVEDFDQIILSPGPGIPSEAGLLLPVIKRFSTSKKILGVCLGHQAIAETFGGTLYNLDAPLHGISRTLSVTQPDLLFAGIPQKFDVGHYHSWAVADEGLPDELEITARDDKEMIMALRHRTLKVRGVQFHPESVLTQYGLDMIRNWIYG
ncbi:MAG: aminodeoxychorismate/anthranilate synthase component II [Mucilaginibacter polytrichastri]|nr:aminodeoxychorismate/anthranilate synthase component II [Mucilaginibacter polytrichastri]